MRIERYYGSSVPHFILVFVVNILFIAVTVAVVNLLHLPRAAHGGAARVTELQAGAG